MTDIRALERVRDALLNLPRDVFYDQTNYVMRHEVKNKQEVCFVCIAGIAVAVEDYDGDFFRAVSAERYKVCEHIFDRARWLLRLTKGEANVLFASVKGNTSPYNAAAAIDRLVAGEPPWTKRQLKQV